MDQSVCITRRCQVGKSSRSGYDNDRYGNRCEDCSTIGKESLDCDIWPFGYGFYSITGEDESVCSKISQYPEGTYSERGDDYIGCIACPEGRYSIEGSKECNLILCNKGFYGATGYQDYRTVEQFHECPENFTTTQLGTKGEEASVCIKNLSLCPEGTWSETGDDMFPCTDCEDGTYSLEGSSYCNLRLCDYGFYITTGYFFMNMMEESIAKNVQMALPPKNQVQKEKMPQFALNQLYVQKTTGYGFYSTTDYGFYEYDGSVDCEKCLDGFTTKQLDKKGLDGIVCSKLSQCPEGTQSERGDDFIGCTDCENDTYSLAGSTECNLRLCDYGFYSTTDYYNFRIGEYCQGCPESFTTKQKGTKGQNDSVCLEISLCPEGTWSERGDDFIGCTDCENGTYSFEGSKECNL
ncbi:hypothetical protein ABPG72_000556 [Tetrahymena utriculariae]